VNKNRSLKMGKSMYDYVNRTKERARQQKQIDKNSERMTAKQEKANIKNIHTPNPGPEIAEQGLPEEVVTRITKSVLK